ncbi:hypothetical protein C8J56DRAFT_891519 [Mycena floridula]|nr:hypothetical protein C8J56DRAFT_891519 [Mycena floridula]
MLPKKKHKPNVAGLRNQQPVVIPEVIIDPQETSDGNEELVTGLHFDSARVNWEHEDEESDVEELDLDDFDDEEFGIRLVEMAEQHDAKDLDWLPQKLHVKTKERKERPKNYNTTADGMNKALSTAYRHASKFTDQNLLDSFRFTSSHVATSTLLVTSKKLSPALKAAMQTGPHLTSNAIDLSWSD